MLQYISLMFGFIFQFTTNKTEFTTIKTLCCNEMKILRTNTHNPLDYLNYIKTPEKIKQLALQDKLSSKKLRNFQNCWNGKEFSFS